MRCGREIIKLHNLLIEMAEQKSPEKEEKKVYTYQDLIKFSNT